MFRAVGERGLPDAKVKVAQLCPTLQPRGPYSPWNSPGQNTGVSICLLLQGIFPTQGSNPGLLHFRQILYHLSNLGSPIFKLNLIKSPSVVPSPPKDIKGS